jgi:hypothetical protein
MAAFELSLHIGPRETGIVLLAEERDRLVPIRQSLGIEGPADGLARHHPDRLAAASRQAAQAIMLSLVDENHETSCHEDSM